MIEFDLAVTSIKSTIVKYFEKNLKLFINAKIDQDATLLDNYKKLVVKAVKAKAKAGLQPSFYI